MIKIRVAVIEPAPKVSLMLPHAYSGANAQSFISLMDFSKAHRRKNFEAVILEESDDFGNDALHTDFLKSHFPDVPLLLITEHSQSDLAIAGRLLSVFAVLARPFSKKDLELVLVGAKVKANFLKPNAATDTLEYMPSASESTSRSQKILY